ncbi:MAG: sortase domain-bontaining protein [Eubacterium sp.]
MGEEKSTSQVNTEQKHKKHRKNHFAVLPYILTPLVFVLISLIVVVPVGFRVMNMAVDTVHKAQETLTMDYNDVQANNNYSKSRTKDEPYRPDSVSKFGEIICKSAGLNADAYYGINRVSLRNGVGISSQASLPGEDGVINAYGYASTCFKALKNVRVGDIITFETSWGMYYYEVTDVLISDRAPTLNTEQGLLLATAESSKAFSCFDGKKLYVVAKLTSGASTGEVQQ